MNRDYGSVCLVCGMYDSAVSSGDCDGCNECYSIEQGFLYITTHEDDNDKTNSLVVDENGNVYREGKELDEPIASEYYYQPSIKE
jgi:hypothetical protein